MTNEIPGRPDYGGPFIVGEKLTVYQAAMVYSGAHPGEQFLEGCSLGEYERFLNRGWRDELGWLRWTVYRQLLEMIGSGEIKPVKLAYMPSGELDPRGVVIKTADVAALAQQRNELAGIPRALDGRGK